MNAVFDAMVARRSVRKYTDEVVTADQLRLIVEAGLMSPSGHSKYPCEFIIVTDRAMLERMSHCRVGAAKMLAGAAAAIVVIADRDKSDVVIEDSAVAMMSMHLMASSMGLGSCWIQVRLREAEDGRSAEEFLRDLLGFPTNYMCQSVLSIGVPARPSRPHDLAKLTLDKIHEERFS